jgi:2-phospho-L-lactate/phosphoenolpyruvate guanylyltransferase
MTARRELWAVVPVKELAEAKHRLSRAFPPAFRRALAIEMLEDVLAALSGGSGLAGIAVVTIDPEMQRVARRRNARVLVDDAAGGHTAGVTAAARVLVAEGREGMLTVPGDIPGVTAAEIGALLDQHGPSPAFTIAPAHDGRGSNAVVLSPSDLVPLAFGNDSFLPHLATARANGIEPKVVRLERLGLDIDTPEDLAAFVGKNWPSRTTEFLKRAGVTPHMDRAAASERHYG